MVELALVVSDNSVWDKGLGMRKDCKNDITVNEI
jgi:hypothetical protein